MTKGSAAQSRPIGRRNTGSAPRKILLRMMRLSAGLSSGGLPDMTDSQRHQSPEWADEIKGRALILINAAGRKAT